MDNWDCYYKRQMRALGTNMSVENQIIIDAIFDQDSTVLSLVSKKEKKMISSSQRWVHCYCYILQ